MISMLENIIFFSAAGEMTFSLFLFGNMTIFNGILFMIGITYKLLPWMRSIEKYSQERIKKR
jgi:hypothetical protein